MEQVLVAVIVLAIGGGNFLLGWKSGKNSGKREAERKLQAYKNAIRFWKQVADKRLKRINRSL